MISETHDLATLRVLVVLALVLAAAASVAAGLMWMRLRDVEDRLSRLSSRTIPPETAAPAVPVAAPQPAAPEPPRPLPWPSLSETGAAPPEPPRDLPWPAKPPEPEAPPQDGPIVLTESRFTALGRWLAAHWVYVVSALSLALAGVYFVQYGIEAGLLPPAARVAGALGLGALLIAAGEWLRRRGSADGATAFLPATFAGAGLVSLFAGVVAARQLYGLIGPETALAGLVAVSAGAVLLGWFHGPFLTAFGLIGASAAPFAVGGESDTPDWLYLWFLAVASVGLAVDAVRRWAWISVLALVLGFGGLFFVYAGIGGAGWFGLAAAALALIALVLPTLSLAPEQDGAMVAETLLRGGKGDWPIFPTRLAAGAVLAAVAALLFLPAETAADDWVALGGLAGLALALTLWTTRAPALADLALLPAAGFLLRLAAEGAARFPLLREHAALAIATREPESAAPWTVPVLVLMALAISLAAAWRSGVETRYRAVWAAGAALVAPMAAAGLELFWNPAPVIGSYHWALWVIGLAAVMAVLAERFARADAEDRRRAAYAVLSCLSLIALALFVTITKGALTLALAVLVAVAAALDRRFRLPEMGWFVQLGVVVLGWRLVVDPGLVWDYEAPLWEVLLAFLGAIAGLAAAHRLMPEGRPGPRLMAETGLASALAVLFDVLLVRWLDARTSDGYWAVSLLALPWLILALVQLARMRLGGWLRWVRAGLAGVAGLIWAGSMAVALIPLNPLVEGRVQGPWLFDTLALAYALPGAVLLAAPRLAPRRWLRIALAACGGLLLTVYAVLEIRRWFRGPDLSVPGTTQGELYAYTVALMVASAVLLYRALALGSPTRRRIAMGLIALTVAKVFLIDAAGLSGLMRVVSFLLLGLALAGVAFLNRWAAAREAALPDPGDHGNG